MLRIPLGDISKSGWLGDLLHISVQESLAKRPGSQSLPAKLSELAFIETLRRAQRFASTSCLCHFGVERACGRHSAANTPHADPVRFCRKRALGK